MKFSILFDGHHNMLGNVHRTYHFWRVHSPNVLDFKYNNNKKSTEHACITNALLHVLQNTH